MPGFPVFYYLLEFAQTHVHCVNDAIHPSHPLSLSSLALNPSQHQGANCKFFFFLLVNFSCRPLQIQLQFRPDKAMAHPERGAEAHTGQSSYLILGQNGEHFYFHLDQLLGVDHPEEGVT